MKRFTTALLFISALATLKANVLLVEGRYQSKNLYIQNGLGQNGVGFCAYEVKVNGQVTTDEVNSTAFEVDLTPFKLNVGDKVVIEIHHKENCKPRVLNPDALRPMPTFEVKSIAVDKEGILKWKTEKESGPLPFVVEQFKWNKWVYVGTVEGIGSPASHEYVFKVTPHSGENKFRVKQVGFNGVSKASTAVTLSSFMDEPSFRVSSKAITFSNDTGYEVYDPFGNVVKKGFGNTCDISNLNRGKYWLCYDNKITEMKKN